MKDLYLLVKPASSLCNMRCVYCFYEDESQNRSLHDHGIMAEAVSEKLIARAIKEVDKGGSISFTFQGGEPTLAGLDYFRHFTETVKRENSKHLHVDYAIQTNGLSLDDNWASFFKENDFLVGISLDGDKAVHDRQRPDAKGKGTWAKVRRSVSLLLKNDIPIDLLCVVTRSCAHSAVRIYHALQKTGVHDLQFIPCLDPLKGERGGLPYSLLPDDYGQFLCDLFDSWYLDLYNGKPVNIRFFTDLIQMVLGAAPSACSSGAGCGSALVVESDGSFYPCDFYALDEWYLGNAGENSLADIINCDTVCRFQKEGNDRPAACEACEWKDICNGGCMRDWVTDPLTQEKKNYYCPAFKRFFPYAMPRIIKTARDIISLYQ